MSLSYRAPRLLVCFAFACLASGCASLGATAPEPAAHPVVVSVIDGDTVTIAFPGGSEETVRLLGVDTPETVDPNRPEQCFGAEASAHVRRLLPPGTPVILERDVEARDHFGRLLAYVTRSDNAVFVNLDLVKAGLADVTFYEPNTAFQSQFEHALTTAKTQQTGLWGTCGGPDVALDPRG